MKQPKNSLQLPKPTRLTTLQITGNDLASKHNFICHTAKVKAATSVHSMVEVIPFQQGPRRPFKSGRAKISGQDKHFLAKTNKH